MANICTTQVTVSGNMSTIDWFEKLVRDYTDEDWIGQFGKVDEDVNINKIGSKWIICTDSYRVDDHEYQITFESAWYSPDIMLVEMSNQLKEVDQSSCVYGRYWDEAFDPIGKFEVVDGGKWFEVEDIVDVDWEDEFYWDNQVEPAFEALEINW